MRRDKLPKILFEPGNRYRRTINLGIYEFVKNKKDHDVLSKKEEEMRLERLGFDEKYFNNRS